MLLAQKCACCALAVYRYECRVYFVRIKYFINNIAYNHHIMKYLY
jgi:hypothetical protein